MASQQREASKTEIATLHMILPDEHYIQPSRKNGIMGCPGDLRDRRQRTLMIVRHCVSNSPNSGGSSFGCLLALRLPGGFAARSAARLRLASVVA